LGSTAANAPVRLLVRPESLSLHPAPAEGAARPGDLLGTILERRFAGPVTHYRVRVGASELSVTGTPGDGRPEETVTVRLSPDAQPLVFAPTEG
jgi:ABC-type Fe3+/spermidine/putrescine transport system ATPase subunit